MMTLCFAIMGCGDDELAENGATCGADDDCKSGNCVEQVDGRKACVAEKPTTAAGGW